MKLTRREFLTLSGRALTASPLLAGLSACTPALISPNPETGLYFGSIVGDVTSGGALIWLRADPGSKVTVHYGRDASLGRFITSAPIAVEKERDDTARIQLEGLQSATTYYYRPVVAGKKPGPICRFFTAPAPDALAPVKFCFSGDSRESYQPFTVMEAIRFMEPKFFVHLGDTIYADRGGAATKLPEFWAKYRGNRRDRASQRLFSGTSVYVIWDDHEVVNDYEGNHPLAAIGWQAFFDYWPIRRHPEESSRLYRSFRWGKTLELFLLDIRQYRDRAGGTMLGQQQKQWLLEGLATSDALFKVVATSVPLYGGGRDRWDGYPQERAELLRWVKAEKIKNLAFISADLHYGAVARLPSKLGKAITAGPIAGPMNVFATGNSGRFEFFANQTFNYGMITIDIASSRPQMLIEIFDYKNERLYKTNLADF